MLPRFFLYYSTVSLFTQKAKFKLDYHWEMNVSRNKGLKFSIMRVSKNLQKRRVLTSKLKGRRMMQLSTFSFIVVGVLLISMKDKLTSHDLVGSNEAQRRVGRCWLKHAFKSGEFNLYSHRSYADSTQSEQPTCEESLTQLKSMGVNHLDLDLVLNESSASAPYLVVGHPMEYKRTSDYYSPCANAEFEVMVQTLFKVYGKDFFISLEPKASWGMSQTEFSDPALTNLPSNILKALLESVERNELNGHCAAIVELNLKQEQAELEEEKQILSKILKHCQLFRGIRLADGAPQSLKEYDILMPTIEFHPSHSHNTGSSLPHSLSEKSVFWVIDNEENLQFAADLRPNGIVSNSPKNIVEILNSPEWCKEE